MIDTPSDPFVDGRDARGRFTKGNPGGPGNPHARRVAALRSTLIREVTKDDIRAIVRRLIDLAKEGDIQAAREVFSRVLGRPIEHDLLERVELLEELLEEAEGR